MSEEGQAGAKALRPRNRRTKSSCQLCLEPDNDDMVQCDSCDEWFHFVCTGTSSDVELRDWSCTSCMTKMAAAGDKSPTNSISSVKSTTLSKRKSIKLRLLEEEKIMQEKRDAEYLRRKFQLLMDESGSDEEVSVLPKNSTTDEQQFSTAATKRSGQLDATHQNTKDTHCSIPKFSAGSTATPCEHNSSAMPLQQQAENHVNFSHSSQRAGNLSKTQLSPQEYVLLSNQQIAARHSSSKDLPIFSGNPEDWPLFNNNFEGSTQLCGFTYEENLMRLQKCLKGKALELVRSRLLLPANVPSIISTLRMIYGRPEIIIRSLMVKVQNEPAPRADRLETVIYFALAVQNMCATMKSANLEGHLSNPVLMQELVDKLPAQIKLNWAVYKRSLSVVNLETFSTWLFELAETVSDVTLTPSLFIENKYDKRQMKEKAHINTHAENNNKDESFKENTRKCKVCSKQCAQVYNCEKFCNMCLNDKWDTLKRLRLCRTCLQHHSYSTCRSNKLCGVNGCTYKHHSLLHKNKEGQRISSPSDTEGSSIVQYNCNTHRSAQPLTYFRIIPVVMHSASATVHTFAFLDEGSSLTLMDASLADELNIVGPTQPLCLKWTGQTQRFEENSQILSAEISSASCSKRYLLHNIRTVNSLNLPEQTLRVSDLATKYNHLRGIPLQSYEHASPRILIGLDNWKLGFPLKAREGDESAPAAIKTRLGWAVYGRCEHEELKQETFHFHVCECKKNDESLHEMMKEYFSLDSLSVTSFSPIVKSVEEVRAAACLETNTIRINNRFETSLLWKFDEVKLPNSFPMAMQRYGCLRRKLLKNPSLANNIKLQMESYLSKGYIRKLSDRDLNKAYERVWYLPIFTVSNINKPGKIRIVWDAAAKVDGISLNSVLSKGPDQLIALTSILYRFRENPVAVCADIREMFHQIRVRETDQQVQRFLWNQDIASCEPNIYVMQVLTFGATCSPSCAQFVKNKNALEYKQKFPRAAESIIQNHYVDDLLISVGTVDEAIKLSNEIKYIHSRCGFEIHNWISNSSKVIEALGGRQAHTVNIGSEESLAERVLGMWWCTSTDSFTFNLSPKASFLQLLNENIRPTKRQVLRMMMTIFDPLGLIAHFIVYIKILMQEIWRTSVQWDEPIQDVQYKKWCIWVRNLKTINRVKIPRCYLNAFTRGENDDLQLHVFVDASENAFAAVAYLRASKKNNVECTLISAKTRVAPLKMMSIPRLELEAARLGARLAKNIVEGHTIKFSQQTFWSDSKTVLSWIQSDHRKYRQFVAFRVSEILDLSYMQQWRYVPTKQNVADDATKWSNSLDFTSPSRWYNGPPFLKEPQELWPQNPFGRETTEELKEHLLHHFEIQQKIIEVERFSSWFKLIRTHVYILRFLWNLSSKKRNISKRTGYIEKDEYLMAENYFYRLAQADDFRNEISIILSNKDLAIGSKKCLNKSSSLYKLSPYLDEHGVLRTKGRIDAALGVANCVKRPILLPKNHYVTNLLVQSYHQRFHHQSNETVINELRQKYYISRMRIVLKKVRNECQQCKNQRASPKPPEMSDLPSARLSTFTRPFSYIGLDYFGPMMVSVGRRREKRWGVLITCLTVRAIHIEVASTLSADSCILAVKRFIARRGVPIEIRCDNGTNFHGAERELREAIKHQNIQLAEEFSSSITKWTLNPPASPHMGGSWERLVQSVKKTLFQILPTRNPTDELLYSMLLETERTINSRPLTYLPLDEESEEALTPNHFLLGSSSGEKPDGISFVDNVLLKKNWLQAQQLANSFWKRWVREYLPTLTRRTKWYQPVKCIEKGDIVIVVDENNPRNTWPKGKVLDVSIGKDGQVRKAIIQTSTGIYERPAVRLAVLDVRGSGRPDKTPGIPRGSVGNANLN